MQYDKILFFKPSGSKGKYKSLFKDHMIVSIENLKESSKKKIGANKQLQKGSKLQGKIQKLITFLCTNN
jgi:hypothetical protein